jgi:hypothetical protein
MRSPVMWLVGVVAAIIVALGVRAFLDPVAASAGFGLPMHTDAETTFVRVYGARNALLGLLALAFMAGGMLRPLTLLFTFATALPLLDAIVITSRIGVGHELVRHAAILLVLAAASTALWRLDAAQRDPLHQNPR